MPYGVLLAELKSHADEEYRIFHKRLLKNDNIETLGVRTPDLRKIAKKYCAQELMTFPDEYYEVTFIKLTAVASLEWEEFIEYIDDCIPLINNWATCDCFAPKCIKKHRDEFLPYIRKYAECGGEFYQRFALTALLHFYVEEEYLETVFALTERSDASLYYVHMAAAWLIAEALVKYYDRTVGFLMENSLDKKTHNKAIQKACESYRLSDDRKNYLKGLKR